jgi:hypothetical protein
MELHFSREMAAVRAELEAERAKYAALEAKHEELKKKQVRIPPSHRCGGCSFMCSPLSCADTLPPPPELASGGVVQNQVRCEEGCVGQTGTRQGTIRSVLSVLLTHCVARVRQPAWMSKVPAKKPVVQPPTRDRQSVMMAPAGGAAVDVSGDAEGSNYRLSMMLQLKSADGSSGADKRKTGFFFSADDLDSQVGWKAWLCLLLC